MSNLPLNSTPLSPSLVLPFANYPIKFRLAIYGPSGDTATAADNNVAEVAVAVAGEAGSEEQKRAADKLRFTHWHNTGTHFLAIILAGT